MTLHRNSVLDLGLIKDTMEHIVEKNRDNNTGVMFGMLLMVVDNVLTREGAMDEFLEYKRQIAVAKELMGDDKDRVKRMLEEMPDDMRNVALAMTYKTYRDKQRESE